MDDLIAFTAIPPGQPTPVGAGFWTGDGFLPASDLPGEQVDLTCVPLHPPRPARLFEGVTVVCVDGPDLWLNNGRMWWDTEPAAAAELVIFEGVAIADIASGRIHGQGSHD